MYLHDFTRLVVASLLGITAFWNLIAIIVTQRKLSAIGNHTIIACFACMGLWILSVILLLYIPSLTIFHIGSAFCILTITLFLQYILTFPLPPTEPRHWLITTPGILTALLALSPNSLATVLHHTAYGYYPVVTQGWLTQPAYALCTTYSVLIMMFLLFRIIHEPSPLLRYTLSFIAKGYALCMIPILTIIIGLPLFFNIYSFIPFAPFFVIILTMSLITIISCSDDKLCNIALQK